MNDRFKFRIWHEPLKQMHYNDFILTATGYLAPIYQQDDYMMKFNQCDLEFDKQCQVMQSTGLKDKNGKLIYEGDIIRSYKSPEFIYRVEYDNEIFASFVLIAVGRLNMFKHYFGEAIDAEKCEVIGNIYENKSLLESEG